MSKRMNNFVSSVIYITNLDNFAHQYKIYGWLILLDQ